ncbi:MAG: isoleucine--tRNA ligase [Deltaproteobacteria bacterium]|nr:isoleucine--tRNA ligase [Deltaproteobacteria bacterium]
MPQYSPPDELGGAGATRRFLLPYRAVFAKVTPVTDFVALENRVLDLWAERRIFEKSLKRNPPDAPTFVFYEGPPTANGLPHNGHVLTRVIKDLFLRYRTMRGQNVPRKAGWDTHGLPVEVEVEKELRIAGKAAIEAYGVEPFVRRCIESVFRYTAEWEHMTKRIGFWVDLDDAYVTFHESYVESVWWALSELFKKDLLYQGHKVVWWWARGGTALSAAEVGQGYRAVDDPSVYVRFPLVDEPGTSLVVWTTTPWTLPSNAFAAVKREVQYVVVRLGEERLILAETLRQAVAAKLGAELPIERTLRGEDLVGKRYRPPFDWYGHLRDARAPLADGRPEHLLWRVLDAPFVELDTGTGIVHEAPAFGEVDFDLFRSERQRFARPEDLPLLCAVEPDGQFGEEAPERYRGRFVKEVDRDLVRELKEQGSLLHAEQIRHEYPFCVRAEQDPLIQYARPAWYIRTTALIDRAIAQNRAIDWLPEHIKEGRFGDFLANNVDWALSRERYWGTPLNIWVNDQTGAMDAPASVSQILEKNPDAFAKFDEDKRRDPSLSPHLRVHKPWIDQVTWTRPGEPGVYRRVPEVIDCWFDSGAMPFAQWGFPHRGTAELVRAFPADFISEAIDQTRGWFYSLLMISTLVFDDETQKRFGLDPARTSPHPFRTCMVLGHVCDREGKKESKSKGNYTPPEVIVDRVKMDFAVVRDDSLADGVAEICPEDFDGLDLSGSPTLAISRADAPGAAATVTVRGKKGLARRVVAVGGALCDRLRVSEGPRGAKVLPAEVPRLAAGERVVLEDRTAPAPGADAFRWFFFASNPPWSNTRHSLSSVRALQKELPLKLRNVYAFFTIYANIDAFDPVANGAGRRAASERAMLDRWILSELAIATRKATELLDRYRVHEATQVLTELVDGLSNWYVRRSRDRFWKSGLDQDKLDAHFTLHECLTTLARLLAPFLPFATEEMWQDLAVPTGSVAESVHLASYPDADTRAVDEVLSAEMAAVREVVSLGLAVRTAQKLKVRQPLESAQVVVAAQGVAEILDRHRALVEEELNVHRLVLRQSAEGLVRWVVRPNFKALGRRLGKKMQAAKAALGSADGMALRAALEEKGRCVVDVEGESIELGRDDVEVSVEALPGYAAATGRAGVVLLETTLTPDLVDEGLYREVLSRIQAVRKERGLEYTARIALTIAGSERLIAVLEPRAQELAQETLALQILFRREPGPGASSHELEVDGEALRLGLGLS